MHLRKTILTTAISLAIAGLAPPGVVQAAGMAKTNQFWWPAQLDLSPLRQHDAEQSPVTDDFDYAQAFSELDLAAVKADIKTLM